MKRKLAAVKNRGSKCKECDMECNKSNLAIFQFHHLDPSIKKAQISNMFDRKIYADIDKELEKCELLCSNCHDLKHSIEF